MFCPGVERQTHLAGAVPAATLNEYLTSLPLQDSDAAATAAREFAEETLGLFGGCGVDAASVVSVGAAAVGMV